MSVSRQVSKKFRFFTFVSVALLVYVHGYNLQATHLMPFSTVAESLTITSFFEYLFANGLLRFRIPLLFLISGYLYAMYDHKPYKTAIKQRFITLMIPYFIWGLWALVFTYLLQQNNYTAQVVKDTAIDQFGNNEPYETLGFIQLFLRWLFGTPAYQLWFLQALFIYNLLYPFLKWILKKTPKLWLMLSLLYLVTMLNIPFIDGRGLFFFSLGIYIQKTNFNIEKEPKWFSLGAALILFIGLAFVKTFMAFELEETLTAQIIILLLYQLSVLCGIVAMWFGLDKIINWCIQKKWFNSLSGYSFFIFGFHVPLLPYTMKWALQTFSHIAYYRLLCYIFIPALIIIICILLGMAVKKIAPKFYAIITGGRGF